MATERVKLDTRAKNILQLFTENMHRLGAINKIAAAGASIGAYDSAEGEINSNQPHSRGGWRFTDSGPEPTQKYFVRELVLSRGTRNVISAAQNDSPDEKMQSGGGGFMGIGDTGAVESAADHLSGRNPADLLKTYGLYSFEQGGHRAKDFMKLKGRKSLRTLLYETWDAFFDKDRPVYRNPQPNADRMMYGSEENEYGPGEVDAYDFHWYDTQGDSFTAPLSEMDILNQALQGFNAGQILGADMSFSNRIKRNAKTLTRAFLEASGAAEDRKEDVADSQIKAYYQYLTGVLNPKEHISQFYVPGWGRPAEGGPRMMQKKPLHENLNQNILLPPQTPNNFSGNGEGPPGFGNYAATFQTLYTRNRAGAAGGVRGAGAANPEALNVAVDNQTFANGILGGRAINLLQEPLANMNAPVIQGKTPSDEDTTPFTFEQDDARYLTYEKRDAGFRSNTETANSQPDKLNVAVRDYEADPDAGAETVKFSNGQHFPFVFSTVNKANERFQICYLQAIINTLSESYAPVWASRHFFGRSEQTHTYTFTDRTIDVGFTIFANTMRQLQNVYERVLWLAQQCYPDFDNTGRLSQGPIIAMRIGDLFQYRVGIIRNLSYDWMFNGGKWETTAGVRMPQGCTVTMSYQVIHERVPDRDFDFYGGPVGGLNTGTSRYRTTSDPNARYTSGTGINAFSPFSETTTSVAGYGPKGRFIPSGALSTGEGGLGEADWVEKMRQINDQTTANISTMEVQRVPVGVSDGQTIYAE